MLYFDRIDVSEGINANKKVHQKDVIMRYKIAILLF